jgi:phosphinothricin acetyltransferase
MAVIRHAGAADASAIAALGNPVIRESVATFNSVEKSPKDVAAMVAASPGAFGLNEEAELLGFARFAKFRAGSGTPAPSSTRSCLRLRHAGEDTGAF